MKKTTIWMTAVLVAASLSACGAADSGSAATTAAAAETTAALESSETGATAAEDDGKGDIVADGDTSTIDAIKERGKFVMMTATGFPPFEYLGADGQPAGVDIEIGKLVADEIGVDYEVLDMDFNLLVEALKNGKGDMIGAAMTVTEERAQQVDFTNTYATAGQTVLLPADSTITSIDDLKADGLIVTVQAGTTGDIYVQDELGISSPLQFKNSVECAAALAAGKADAAVIDDVAASALVQNYDGKLKSLDEPATQEEYALAIAKGHNDLLELVNTVISKAQADGTIDQLMAEHTEASSEG